MEGLKYDGEKPMMHLLPPKATIEVAKVLTFGAQKYDEENWRKLENLQSRYTSGALRHIFAHIDSEALDTESGLSHLAHAICCLLFKLEIELETRTEKEKLRESDSTEYSACSDALESYRQEQEADYKKRSVQHIKHLIQYYSTD